MPYFDAKRLSDTLDLLEGTTLVARGVRDPVYRFVKDFADANLSKKKSEFYKGVVGTAMSMKGVENKGDKQTRRMRRGLVLLWQAMLNPDKVREAKVIGPGLVQNEFVATMKKCKAKVDMNRGITAGNQDILDNEFRRDPEGFLTQNEVVVFGIKADSQPLNDLGDFKFYWEASKDRFYFRAAGAPPGAYPVRAYSIPAILWADVPGRGSEADGSFAQIQGTEIGTAANLALTTQFTGCSFCCGLVNGRLNAAHIAPSNKAWVSAEDALSIDPTKLAEQIRDTGKFDGAAETDTLRLYGRSLGKNTFANGYKYKSGSSGSKNWMTVVGFHRDVGGWSFHTQSVCAENDSPIRVRKLYPNQHETVA